MQRPVCFVGTDRYWKDRDEGWLLDGRLWTEDSRLITGSVLPTIGYSFIDEAIMKQRA